MTTNTDPTISNLTGRNLTFDQPTLLNHQFTISETDSPEYFVHTTRSPHKPDLTIREQTKQGPIKGLAWFRWTKIKFGVGDNDTSMSWSEMTPKGPLTGVKHVFEWRGNLFSAQRIKSAERRVMGLERATLSHYQVVDEGSRMVVGVFLSERGFRGKGNIRFVEGLQEDLQVLILLVVASLRERRRRAG